MFSDVFDIRVDPETYQNCYQNRFRKPNKFHTFFSMHQDDLDSITKYIEQSLFQDGIELATIAKKIDKLTPSRLVNMADIMSFLKKHQAIQQSSNLLQLEEYLSNKKKQLFMKKGTE